MLWIIVIAVIIFIFFIFKILSIRNSLYGKTLRPFLDLYAIDKNGNEILTNILFITHPFSNNSQIEMYQDKKANGNLFLGMTSYSEFPGMISNPHDRFRNPDDIAWKYNYNEIVDGWCYCFRKPENFIKVDRPSILLSESDFANYEYLVPNPNITPEYDFIYICIKDNDTCTAGWQSYNRNWEKAKLMLDIMCNDFGLKGLLIGRINCEIPASCHHLMNLTDFQTYQEFIKNYNKVRFIFVPNITDASPRVVTEAMCFNLPVFMNEDILGGWKYISPEVGELFKNDMSNFSEKLRIFLNNLNSYTPRKYFIENYGKYNSGKKLLSFVKQVYPKEKLNFDIDSVVYMKPAV